VVVVVVVVLDVVELDVLGAKVPKGGGASEEKPNLNCIK
jgi:hypothetical protein